MHINDVLVLQNDLIISLLRMIAENTGGDEFQLSDMFEEKITDAHKLAEDWRSEE